ncbi:DNA-binding protein, partial [Stenotrophomonas sp. MA5]
MAKGISELDVHQAADDIIAAGERPTVERIRAHLGTGSPNTVTRWLETWWQTVGFRLRQRAIEAAVPGIPERVAHLSQRLWQAALQDA